MPTRVVVGFVRTQAFEGTFETSSDAQKNNAPFDFLNLGISEIAMKIASKSLPYSSALKPNFAENNYFEAYNSLFKNISQSPNDISYEEYKNGNTLFAFDLTPDLCTEEHYSLLKDGSLDLEVSMIPIDKSVTAIFYLEFDNILQITKERQILFDYKI
jgi:hypothetical protein